MALATSLEVAILLLGCLALVFWAGRRNDRFLYLAGFLIPLRSIVFRFYVDFVWMLLVFPLSLAAIVVHKKQVRWQDIEGRRWLVLYFAYAFYLTLIRAYLDYTSRAPRYLQAIAYGWGPGQSTYRYPVQFLSFMFAWGLLFTGFWFTRERRDVVALIKGYVNGNLFNALLGFYQLAAYRWYLPWPTQLEMGAPHGQDLGSAAGRAQLRGLDMPLAIHRLSGIGGEAKHAATSFVMAIVLLLCLEVLAGKDSPIRHGKAKLFVLIMALFLTSSTGGWLSMLCVGAYFLVTSLLRGRSQIVGYVLLGLLVLVVAAQLFGGFQTLQDMYEVRLVNRLSGGLEGLSNYEPKDTAFIQYAFTHPLNMVLGHGTGGIDFWIMTSNYLERWVSERSSTVTPAYLPTRLLGDIGLVGLVFLGLLGWQWSKKLEEAGLPAYRQFLIAGALALTFASQMSLPGYLLLCASMVAYACRVKGVNVRLEKQILAYSIRNRARAKVLEQQDG